MTASSTGLELILNAAEGVLQIVVTQNEAVLCVQEWHRPERATEILTPALQAICASLGIAPSGFKRIACVRGPGSFTGIRLVLTTAAALRRTGHAQLAALDFLQALACSAAIRRSLPYGVPVWTVTHARANLVHCRPFVAMGPIIPPAPLQDVDLCPPDEALRRILTESESARIPSQTQARHTPCCICGSALTRHAAIFGSFAAMSDTVHPMPELTNPDGAALRLLARHGDYAAEDIEPLYARPCDAAENLPQIAARRNMDPNSATAELEHLLQAWPTSDI
ncbi:MAG: tRNA threonylcarbamoyladenosine biosynthesis protein TsaB [Candidatus Desulfovibrio kirbyi]|jgi:tRNA threonylcarbamoyl adenosine modification protein YeaZ|uniref:tRNA threonylcarbamoyladenosine biosynthesis protein TsaB n=1 Tax=Candidatus Desulfovibrio kirbyi TaxID=2696086 RepID=A0A6L2R4F7_9BACT|nr:tRNA (adenosine(37)-N6)-threonylcarbamoyltransferase complex dimerization subunit type 1 TsaB [Desulfovibrio sp.]GFH62385.1 MAG: tRNA threonylcarbamoyladenosine biosynthesis protein TsaB [Candidatus Desulfovibrio kirbyi]